MTLKLLALLCCGAGLMAQSFTFTGKTDGRLWNSFPDYARTIWLSGFREGLFAGHRASVSSDEYKTRDDTICVNAKMTNGEWVDIISDFFKDASNARVEMGTAYMWGCAKLQGWRPDELASLAARMRKRAAQAESSEK